MGFVEIVLGVNSVLLIIVGYLYKKRDDDQERKLDSLDRDQDKLWDKIETMEGHLSSIKTNYLDRFEVTNKNISETRIEIVTQISSLREELINCKLQTKGVTNERLKK